MYALLALGTTALLLCLILTPICRDIFLKLKVVDMPDERKLHRKPIPRIGGIPIALSYVGALALMLAFAPPQAKIAVQHRGLLFSLLPAAGLVFFTGLIDDLITLRPWQKLSGQIIAATWAVAAGARIHVLEGYPYAEWITVPLSIVWLVGCTNAFNLIDGLDGLASGIGLFATLTTLLAALLQGNWGLAMATVPLVGCLLGFLRYNFNPASIFLGDSGSLSIGFILGCFGVIWSQKSATLLGMVAPAMALALPLLDVGLSIGRRFLRNQPIFQPDRGHIHHRLLALGFEPRGAAIVLYVACGLAAALSLLQSSLSYHVGGLIIILFCAFTWLGIKRLGYIEFSTARRVLATGGVLRLVQHEIYLSHFRESLLNARTRRECWTTIRDACKHLHFASVELTLESETFQEIINPAVAETAWLFTMSFGNKGNVSLRRSMGSESQSLLNSFFQILQDSVGVKTYLPDAIPAAKHGTNGFGKTAIVLPPFQTTRSNTSSLPLTTVRSRQSSNSLGD
ncbi:MAG: undecaprenyl/decaprenyl-phosphate alpha-N-acetylglucosaminyl 1-phosphate transferase [Acidobacteriota bacterium]|nr:undecaprenyl/decaprenyl-phosphate alpha-N-acetylglucosaminyl 1-phosphate transferase [Acidobacteriota bacterium]